MHVCALSNVSLFEKASIGRANNTQELAWQFVPFSFYLIYILQSALPDWHSQWAPLATPTCSSSRRRAAGRRWPTPSPWPSAWRRTGRQGPFFAPPPCSGCIPRGGGPASVISEDLRGVVFGTKLRKILGMPSGGMTLGGLPLSGVPRRAGRVGGSPLSQGS